MTKLQEKTVEHFERNRSSSRGGAIRQGHVCFLAITTAKSRRRSGLANDPRVKMSRQESMEGSVGGSPRNRGTAWATPCSHSAGRTPAPGRDWEKRDAGGDASTVLIHVGVHRAYFCVRRSARGRSNRKIRSAPSIGASHVREKTGSVTVAGGTGDREERRGEVDESGLLRADDSVVDISIARQRKLKNFRAKVEC